MTAVCSATGQAQLAAGNPPDSGTLLGNLGGVRPALDRYGISLGLQTTDEVFGNPNGGRARGATFDGQATLSLGVDLEKAVDLKGGILNISTFYQYGHGISASNIDNLNTVSNIEAYRSFWLYELWYQQSFLDGAVDVRIGQLGADTEFMITQNGSWFINSAFGWPTLASVDLPAGGPSYPLATPGIRLRVKPFEPLTLLLGVFNGDPAGPGLGNPERRGAPGTRFRVGDGVFAIAEAQYAVSSAGLPPLTLKAGAWFHSKAITNQYFATNGYTVVPPSVPGSSIARQNWSVYGVLDAMLIPGPGGKGGLSAFARIDSSPAARSAVSFELTVGLVYNGPFGRDGDQVGFGVSSVRVGQALGGGTSASQYTFHGNETVLELSYQGQVLPWLQLQPDVQYIITPGGGISNPDPTGKRVGSAAVFGVRAAATF